MSGLTCNCDVSDGIGKFCGGEYQTNHTKCIGGLSICDVYPVKCILCSCVCNYRTFLPFLCCCDCNDCVGVSLCYCSRDCFCYKNRCVHPILSNLKEPEEQKMN